MLREKYDNIHNLLELNRDATPDMVLQLLSSTAEPDGMSATTLSLHTALTNALGKVVATEKKLGIAVNDRWTETSPKFIAAYRKEWEKKRDDAKEKLRTVLVGRQVLQDSLHRNGKLGKAGEKA